MLTDLDIIRWALEESKKDAEFIGLDLNSAKYKVYAAGQRAAATRIMARLRTEGILRPRVIQKDGIQVTQYVF